MGMYGGNIRPSNNIPARNVYGSAGGATLSQAANSTSRYNAGMQSAASAGEVQAESTDMLMHAREVAAKGNPLVWWGVLALLFVGLWYGSQKLGGIEDFKNIRLTFHNVIIVTLCVIIGLPIVKFILIKFPVPGLSGVVMMA